MARRSRSTTKKNEVRILATEDGLLVSGPQTAHSEPDDVEMDYLVSIVSYLNNLRSHAETALPTFTPAQRHELAGLIRTNVEVAGDWLEERGLHRNLALVLVPIRVIEPRLREESEGDE